MYRTNLRMRIAVGIIGIGAMLGGCDRADVDEPLQHISIEPQASSAAAASPDDQRVFDEMSRLGFDPASVELAEGVVRAGGDMVFERDALLDGAYGYLRRQTASAHDKGYRYSGALLFRPSDIRLVNENVPSNLSWGIGWAGLMWSHQSNGKINMSPTINGTGGRIHILMVDIAQWSTTPCSSGAQGCVSSFPLYGYPPSVVYMKSKPFSNCEWNQYTFAAVLIHELGHALGIVHPSPTQGPHIPGTAKCKLAADGKCYSDANGYDTIMNSTQFTSTCALVDNLDLYPRADDLASARALYP